MKNKQETRVLNIQTILKNKIQEMDITEFIKYDWKSDKYVIDFRFYDEICGENIDLIPNSDKTENVTIIYGHDSTNVPPDCNVWG